MNVLNTPEFKVGILILIVGAIIAVMSVKVSEDPSYLGSSHTAHFLMNDATGLVQNSPVYVAGIRVGVIKEIGLQSGLARILVTVNKDVRLTTSARVEIRAAGILGDKNVVIIPGDPNDPPLPEGGLIGSVDDQASIERLISEVSKITTTLSGVAENLKNATEGDSQTSLGRIIKNIEQLSGDLAEVSSGNKEKVADIVDRVHSISSTLDNFLNDESDEGFKAAWRQAIASLKNVERTVSNFEEISDKINRGEGTVGRLINDEETVEELNTALKGVNNFLDGGSKLQTSLDFNTVYLSGDEDFKSRLGIKIEPGLDRYYYVGIVDSPVGPSKTTETTTSINGGPETIENKREIFRDRIKFDALFAKNFYNWSLKGGVLESTGGFGVDYHMLGRKLILSAEAYDLEDFRARARVRYDFIKGVYVVGGADDLLDETKSKTNTFIGAGLFLTNDDLKLLLSKVGM